MSDESGMVGAAVGRLMILLRKYHGAWNGRAPLSPDFRHRDDPSLCRWDSLTLVELRKQSWLGEVIPQKEQVDLGLG